MTGQTILPADTDLVLLLVGGGHAHVAVLADWIRKGAPGQLHPVLLTPEPVLRYSGMVPGWIAGQHKIDDGLVDLAGLAARAGVTLVSDSCVGLDPETRTVRLASGGTLRFTIVSIDTGGEGQAVQKLGNDPRLIDVRPIGAFVRQVANIGAPQNVVVIGGGAGGVELAFALRNRAGSIARPSVTLIAGKAGLLAGFAPAVQRLAAGALARQGIAVISDDARLDNGVLIAGARAIEPADCIIAAMGSAAPGWVRDSGLATDKAGYLAVNAYQQSPSHRFVFAAGDVAARTDRDLPHSGVHAVFAGPVLAANLRRAAAGKAPAATYRPRWNNLYLMNTGDGSAIGSYGPLAAEGRWVLALKHAIDRRWIAKYAQLAQKR
ncbi:FAD-dependent oxidoreductase [Erythrobacter sp. R86502]|uniref:FAD-dependent oxidoreductase n=1 Tax=Erythrobacter sp. R86502 TaxID=3093846 RepID=UPI0036D2831B